METMEYTTNGTYAVSESEDMRKLFVSKIPPDSTDEDIKSFLEQMCGGAVTEHAVIRKETAKNGHFGFFTFANSKLVDEVIFKENQLNFNNTTLEVSRACPKKDYLTGAHLKTKKLFISKVPKVGISGEEIKRYFDAMHDPKYGTIESVQLIKKRDDAGSVMEENKGFGFVTVSSEHLADTMSIQHETFNCCGYKIELRKSDPDSPGSRGGQRGSRGGRGGRGRGGSQVGSAQNGQYGGYGGYGSGYGDGYGQWDYGSYYSGYGTYPQYGVSSAVSGRGGGRGGSRGGRGGRGKRYTPYAGKSN